MIGSGGPRGSSRGSRRRWRRRAGAWSPTRAAWTAPSCSRSPAALLGDRAAAATVRTLFHDRGEAEDARRRAVALGARHETVELDLRAHPEVLANPADRCYLCKRLVFTALRRRADELGLPVLADATQADDLGERRPGLRALRELGVASPLADAGLGKAEIRALSAALGIEGADRPSAPCLATRVPFGSRSRRSAWSGSPALSAPCWRWALPTPACATTATWRASSCSPATWSGPPAPALRQRIVEQLRGLGYRHVTLDLAGYRTGSMDEGLTQEDRN